MAYILDVISRIWTWLIILHMSYVSKLVVLLCTHFLGYTKWRFAIWHVTLCGMWRHFLLTLVPARNVMGIRPPHHMYYVIQVLCHFKYILSSLSRCCRKLRLRRANLNFLQQTRLGSWNTRVRMSVPIMYSQSCRKSLILVSCLVGRFYWKPLWAKFAFCSLWASMSHLCMVHP